MGQIKKVSDILDQIEGQKMSVKEGIEHYNVLVNREPNPDWVKMNPIAQNAKYIPIERVEWLLTQLFKRYKVEILKTHVMANSACCDVRLHVQHPITEEWTFQDGTGASPIITEKKAGAMEWDKVQSMSVMKALPAAKSYAISDASHHFGKIFGRDLNRKDQIMYTAMVNKSEEDQNPGELIPADRFKDLRKALNEADIPEDEVVYYDNICRTGQLTWEQYSTTLAYLQANKKDAIARGDRYSNKEIQEKLDSHV